MQPSFACITPANIWVCADGHNCVANGETAHRIAPVEMMGEATPLRDPSRQAQSRQGHGTDWDALSCPNARQLQHRSRREASNP